MATPTAAVPEVQVLRQSFQHPARKGSTTLDLRDYEGQTVVAILDEFVTDGDGKNVGAKIRLFDETGQIGAGTYRSGRLASQFTEIGQAIGAKVKAFGRGALLDVPDDDAAVSRAIAGMTSALS